MTIQLSSQTENPWCRVMLARVDEDGEFCLNKWDAVMETPRLLDLRTGDFYIADSEVDVIGKCMALATALIPYTMGQMAWSSSRCIFAIPLIMLPALGDFVADCYAGVGVMKACESLKDRVTTELPKEMKTHGGYVLFAPVFAFEVLKSALNGIIDPWEGRKWEAKAELAWQNGASFKEDVRLQCCKGKAFYLGWCFQPRGNLNEGKYGITHVGWR
jgi:hypothetical protein